MRRSIDFNFARPNPSWYSGQEHLPGILDSRNLPVSSLPLNEILVWMHGMVTLAYIPSGPCDRRHLFGNFPLSSPWHIICKCDINRTSTFYGKSNNTPTKQKTWKNHWLNHDSPILRIGVFLPWFLCELVDPLLLQNTWRYIACFWHASMVSTLASFLLTVEK